MGLRGFEASLVCIMSSGRGAIVRRCLKKEKKMVGVYGGLNENVPHNLGGLNT